MTEKIEVIYLDMDGVIADFITPSLRAADIPLKHDDVAQWNYFEPYMTAEEFWSRIAADETFWLDIDPYPWANELFEACKRVAPVIFCSSPCADPRCAAQKIQWLRIHGFMGSDENNYILTPHKEHFAAPFRVLIDDSQKNVDTFKKHGGYGIEFPQKYNTMYQWTGDRVGSVIDDLMNPPWDCTTSGDSKQSNGFKESNPKDNVGSKKPGLSSLPCAPLYEAAAALEYGGKKYGKHNWRAIGVRSSVYYDAALRHLTAWWEGEDIDPVENGGSGLPHLAHAIAGLMVYRDSEIIGNHTDDRPIRTTNPSSRLNSLVAEICDRFPSPVAPYTEIGQK